MRSPDPESASHARRRHNRAIRRRRFDPRRSTTPGMRDATDSAFSASSIDCTYATQEDDSANAHVHRVSIVVVSESSRSSRCTSSRMSSSSRSMISLVSASRGTELSNASSLFLLGVISRFALPAADDFELLSHDAKVQPRDRPARSMFRPPRSPSIWSIVPGRPANRPLRPKCRPERLRVSVAELLVVVVGLSHHVGRDDFVAHLVFQLAHPSTELPDRSRLRAAAPNRRDRSDRATRLLTTTATGIPASSRNSRICCSIVWSVVAHVGILRSAHRDVRSCSASGA